MQLIRREYAFFIRTEFAARWRNDSFQGRLGWPVYLVKSLSVTNTNVARLRLTDMPGLSTLLNADGMIGKVVRPHFDTQPKPVHAILFDKSLATNWALGWHQDRTIAVKQRVEAAGIPHVAPPMALLDRMITIRLHLDDVSENNAPLLIASGSHLFGRIAESEIDDVVARCGVFSCTAEAGDVWLYSTPILHASDRAVNPTHRRILQVDYSVDDLPDGLEWQGV